MRIHAKILVAAIIVCGFSASSFCLNYDGSVRQVTSRKRPSLFHRPRKHTPVEQLEYARQLKDKADYHAAGRQYTALVHTWHHTREAVQAQLEFARLLEDRRKYETAFEEYQYLVPLVPVTDYYKKTPLEA